MKKFYMACFSSLLSTLIWATPLSYTFSTALSATASIGAYTPITEIYWGADDELSAPYPIGFSFAFGGATYTQFEVSSNGWITFNLYPFVLNNPQSEPVNNLATDAVMRPGIAPLWDDMAFNVNSAPSPEVGYQLTGVAPNRILHIQFNDVNWKNIATPVSPAEISFEVQLYETTNVIKFIYTDLGGAVSAGASASIGLAGSAVGDYYSLNNSSAAPTASKTVNTTSIATKPASSQIYIWTPLVATPVELEYFTAQNTGNSVELNWATASETNNKLFTIERTADQIDWQTIFSEPGAGNSTTTLLYSTMDENPLEGISYYRLKQTDFDGHFIYYPAASVTESPLVNNMVIEPNPVSGQGTLIYQSAIGSAATVTISDCMGRIIKNQSVTAQESTTYLPLDMSGYNNGIYFITINTPTRQSTSRCVVLH